MRVISKKRLRDFWEILPAAKTSLEQWYKVVSGANWLHFGELRNTFNHADVATTNKGHPVVIFDVGGNKYRIIAALHDDRNICYVLRVLTHKQYDTNRDYALDALPGLVHADGKCTTSSSCCGRLGSI